MVDTEDDIVPDGRMVVITKSIPKTSPTVDFIWVSFESHLFKTKNVEFN